MERLEKGLDVRELIPQVYNQLRWAAKSFARGKPPSLTLQATELVNEACIRLMHSAKIDCQSPEHFRSIATKTVWRVLADYLRKRHAQKRTNQSDHQVSDAVMFVNWMDRDVEITNLVNAIESLANVHARPHDIIILHWFGGLTCQEVARTLAVSVSTVEKDCRFAIAWLNRSLSRASHE